MKRDLTQKIEQFPSSPGIYLMKDGRGEVVYVGKASNLKMRVASYFHSGSDDRRLISRRLGEVSDIDIVVARSEKEALLLEGNFIKQFRPRYNVLFRDDKSFVSIKIPANEPYPRPVITRRTGDPTAKYFGPYSNSKAARHTLSLLHDLFPLRKCSLRQFKNAVRPCLYGQMRKCLAPCCREVSESDYQQLLNELTLFLEGRCAELIEQMQREMTEAADQQEFERAAVLSDRINDVKETIEKQLVSSDMDRIDRDIFGYHPTEGSVWISVLFIRDGHMRDADSFCFPAELDTADTILRSFIKQFYLGDTPIPDEILIPVDPDDLGLLAEWLSEKRGRKTTVLQPQKGRKKRLVELAIRNARQSHSVNTTDSDRRAMELESLQNSLALKKLPVNIECFDISNLSGREAVGSMVVFRNARADKSSYRRFRIRDAEGRDDCAMMKEVIKRRFRRREKGKEGEGWGEMPELIVLDGGRNQLEAACSALAELHVPANDIVALAKARARGGRRLKRERVFVPGREGAVDLDEKSYACILLTRIRDEAHRFAVQYHRKLRRKAFLESPLADVPGVGAALAERILHRFKSLENVRNAAIDELCEVKGISMRKAEAIRRHLKKDRG